MSAEAPLRVIIADDDPLARRVIKGALQAAGMIVVAEAKDGREAVELAVYYRPDVVVMDVVMPQLDGILATRRILKQVPDQLVVVLTGSAEDDELGLLAVEAGAVGFLSKDADIDALPPALEGVRRGEGAISREMTRLLMDRFRGSGGSSGLRPIKSPLTAREWEVIDLLKPGQSTDQVADTLVLSPETVRSHIKNIMRKLEVHSRADALAAAERLRLRLPTPAH